MKARGVSMRSVIQAKFIPKNPVTKVSGRKMVAKTASLPRIWVWAWSVSQVSLQVLLESAGQLEDMLTTTDQMPFANFIRPEVTAECESRHGLPRS
jgi:hypothetical protein